MKITKEQLRKLIQEQAISSGDNMRQLMEDMEDHIRDARTSLELAQQARQQMGAGPDQSLDQAVFILQDLVDGVDYNG
jgi:hypothetical protein